MLLIYMSFIDDESHRRLFEEIYLSYRKQMFLVARTVLKNDSDAEDIVHDVFLRIAKKYMAKISTIENETDLRNYLLKATKNAALDHLRKHRHERVRTKEENETDVPDSEEMPDDAFVEKIHNRIEYKKIVSAIAVMICIMLLASCCIVAAAASGSENVGGGFWAWETIPGFMAKSSYLHRLQRHSASAQVGAGEIVRDVVDANKTAIATAWGLFGTCRVWWDNNP